MNPFPSSSSSASASATNAHGAVGSNNIDRAAVAVGRRAGEGGGQSSDSEIDDRVEESAVVDAEERMFREQLAANTEASAVLATRAKELLRMREEMDDRRSDFILRRIHCK